MLGISLTKIVLTVSVFFVVFYGFKYVQALIRRSQDLDVDRNLVSDSTAVKEMQKCEICGTYFAKEVLSTCTHKNCSSR